MEKIIINHENYVIMDDEGPLFEGTYSDMIRALDYITKDTNYMVDKGFSFSDLQALNKLYWNERTRKPNAKFKLFKTTHKIEQLNYE